MNTEKNSAYPYAKSIAEQFVQARLNATPLASYPCPTPPPDLDSAYACQNEAIKLWPDAVAGWKIGKIPDHVQHQFGTINRLGGPIFQKGVHYAKDGDTVACGVFVGGTACLEAEYVIEVGMDAPADKTKYTMEEAADLAGRLYVGIEMAGSPLANINAQGPCVVISDFGNNADEIIGPEILNWREIKWEDLTVATYIDEILVGEGSAANVPGGPIESLQFIAENCASRGLPLKKGMFISTGAATGVHDIVASQNGRIDFKGLATLKITTSPRTRK